MIQSIDKRNNLAPVVLFTYNRPWHTRRTVEALQKNELADQSDLFIYSDGAKNENAEAQVKEVRDFLKTIDGFKKITIIEREKNFGLASNIITGVTEIINKYGKIIVLEDDIVTSRYFLRFMNDALEKYKDYERVMHISGYNFPINSENLPDTFFIKPASCWSWATWDRAWKYFKKDTDYFIKKFNKKMIYDFNLDNSFRHFDQVILNKLGIINTWAVFWYASVYLNNGLSLHPKISFVKNIGFDGSGMNCNETSVFDVDLAVKYPVIFEETIKESSAARKKYIEYYNSIKTPLWKRVINKLKKIL